MSAVESCPPGLPQARTGRDPYRDGTAYRGRGGAQHHHPGREEEAPVYHPGLGGTVSDRGKGITVGCLFCSLGYV